MSKNKTKKTVLGLSFYQAIALLLTFFAIITVCYILYQNLPAKNFITHPAIIVTEDIKNTSAQADDNKDTIGDFIFDHEYFAADQDALDFNIDNLDENIDEIEKLIEQNEQSDDISEPEIISTPQAEETNLLTQTTEETIKETATEDITYHQEPEIPMLAIVVDDMGINKKRTLDIISLNAELTSSFLTYGNDLKNLALMAKNSGHEVMIHAPMEPKVEASLAPDTLKTDMNKEEIESLFNQMLQKFEGIDVKGINNHMGSKFTEDKERLGYVMNIVKQQNMFFLDSKTSSTSKGKELAQENTIDFAQRDVFLDNENNYDYILEQLTKAEKIAEKKGFAIAICHPKSQTYLALKDWLETLKDKNIKLVHVSKIVANVNKK